MPLVPAVSRVLAGVVVVLAAGLGGALTGGCGTFSIGRPPSDVDLRSDGSPEARGELARRYQLAYRDGWIERPGATREIVAAETGLDVIQVRTGAWSDEAAEHFSSSEAAAEATDTALVGFDRFANSGTPPLILQAGGVLVGTAVGATLVIVNGPASDDAATQLTLVANGAFAGAFTGLLLSLPLVIVYDWTVPALAQALSASDYRRGVRAYNKDLSARITAGSAAPPPPGAPPPDAAPVPTPPPDAAPAPSPDAPPAPLETPSSG